MSGRDQIFGKLLKLKVPNRDTVTMDPIATVEVLADKFYIVDPTDTSKRMRFDASGITTATDRTETLPDYNVGVGGAGTRRNVLSGEASLALTDAMSGSLILMDDATQAFVLPALTAANIGIFYDFESTVAATTTTITAGAADLLTGGLAGQSTTAGGADFFAPDVSDDLVITLNGTTTGGAIGTRIRLEGISATRWLVSGYTNGSGTLLTPFS